MPSDHPDYQPISTPTLPDFGEGQEVWFQSETKEVTAGESYDLINYVVPDDMELRVCSGIVSCEAPRTQKFKFITTPAGDWVSPTSYIDPDDKWSEEEKAYDGFTDTRAIVYEKDYYLELLLSSPITCSKVRIYAATAYGFPLMFSDPDIDIDVYYEGAWHNIFSGVISRGWVKTSFTEKTVSKARIKWNEDLLPESKYGFLAEFEFDMTGETAQETIYFDTYAIIPYLPEAPYPVPSGATFAIKVYNDDDAAQSFSVNLAGFLQAKV